MSEVPAKVRWRCRRGMKEMDVLLERFLAGGYARLDDSERSQFAALLDTPDQDLIAWIMGRTAPPGAFAPVIEALRGTLPPP